MARYATLGQVLARAGRLRNAWTETSQPSVGDIEGFVIDLSGQVDALLAAHGVPVPVTDPVALAAVADPVAYGALERAIDAQYPAGSGPNEITALRAVASKTWDDAAAALASGAHPVVRYFESLASAAESTDFWTEHPDYGLPGSPFTVEGGANLNLAPWIARTDRF